LNNHPQVSESVRRRVLAASNQAGYDLDAGRRATNIALVYTGEVSIGSTFDAALTAGISRAMEQERFDLLMLDAHRARVGSESFTQMFMRKGIRGAILRTTLAVHGVCKTIAEEGFPAVVVGDRFDAPGINYIYCDSRDASRDAVQHLIGLGHKRIAVCINVIDDTDHADRLAGYRQALEDHDIEFDSRLLLRVPATRDGGVQAIRRLLTMPDKPSAVFLTDPITAVGATSEARKIGLKIPDDLSIVGFDDSDVRYGLYPALTAVCQDAEALGREAFSALKTLLNRQKSTVREASPTPIRKALRTWLEVHESTGPVK
jgi:DNA-binding LacI/PurR family transcriptional regulator